MSQIDYKIYRVACLTIINAMLFQELLAKSKPIKTLRQTVECLDVLAELNTEWKKIEEEIDFVPIFRIARAILLTFPSAPETNKALITLARSALKISNNRAALRHDLMGRIFHKLLSNAKYYGAFYTKIPSATLLLKLAIGENDWSLDWKKPKSIGKLRIADLSCGTGTLLKAAIASLVDKHIEKCNSEGLRSDPDILHKVLVENSIWGFDVLFSAVHLASTAIAAHNPNVAVERIQIFTVPLGGNSYKLGSIEFAKRTTKRVIHIQKTLVGATIGPQDSISQESKSIEMPSLHLCTMNPPFTRSVYGNLLFGGINEDERETLQKRLRKLLNESELEANITSGLGSVFVAIADSMIENNGVLALVLPKTVLSGDSWEETRTIFKKYHLQYVVSTHEPNNWYFSESSDISEVLLVLSKNKIKQSSPTIFINLIAQPKSSIEALTLAHIIKSKAIADLSSNSGTCEINTDEKKFGEAVKLTRKQIENTPWSLPISFAQTDLCRIAYKLFKEMLIILPGSEKTSRINLINLERIAKLGPDGRDIYDGFDLSNSITPYPALWGYDSKVINTIIQSSNKYLNPLPSPKKGRSLRDVTSLWIKSGRLMLPKELRLTTSSIVSVNLSLPALANVWWPTKWISDNEEISVLMEKRLSLWFNSTLGLFTMLMQRQETSGSWVKFPKNWYEKLSVLNLNSLDINHLNKLDDLWDEISKKILKPFPEMDQDENRKIIDDTFSEILGLPSLDILRNMLVREPFISMKI